MLHVMNAPRISRIGQPKSEIKYALKKKTYARVDVSYHNLSFGRWGCRACVRYNDKFRVRVSSKFLSVAIRDDFMRAL